MKAGTSRGPARLQALLAAAAADKFAQIGRDGLGDELREAVEQCLERLPDSSELLELRRALEGFDRQGRQDRSVVVAKAMRVCRGLPLPKARTSSASKRGRRGTSKSSGARSAQATGDGSSASTPESELDGVDVLPGVGPATAEKLRAKGLARVVDLLFLLPAGYEDRRRRKPVSELRDGEVAVLEGTVRSIRQGFARGRFMATVELDVTDPDGTTHQVQARWFHRVGGLQRYNQGGRVLAIGPMRWFREKPSLVHPELRDPDDPGPAIAVRYPAVEGIPPRTLTRLIEKALGRIDAPRTGFVDPLPEDLVARHGFMPQREALLSLHRPADDLDDDAVERLKTARSAAHRRLAFDEFFLVQLTLLQERGDWQAEPARVRVDAEAVSREELRACLPFEPTGAQWRVISEIGADMQAGPPMLRLLQGDVGSGKTAVAFAASWSTVRSGGQVALMAPTEILAEQHMRTLAPWCEAAGLRVALLTGSTPKGQRASLLSLLGAGQLDLVVGTHALLTSDVHFERLGLVIIDEQHRFGVEQRATLRDKGERPHLLVMTATPIPRTMALCAYGELEVSVIDEMPPGRSPPRTFLFPGARGLDRARRGLAKRLAAGDRAFVVCPLVEASDVLEATDVEATAADLRRRLPQARIGVIHGRMAPKDKDAVMRSFRDGELDVLVATTVIEVGVDVPDAKTIVVEHAERFGLAQLHQLRGRVGRGGGESFCILHTAYGEASDAAQRLSILCETSDGFVVAERDLSLRGPGEVFGARQAGAPRLRFAGFAGEGTQLLVAARDAAKDLLARDPDLETAPELRAELARRASERVYSADSG